MDSNLTYAARMFARDPDQYGERYAAAIVRAGGAQTDLERQVLADCGLSPRFVDFLQESERNVATDGRTWRRMAYPIGFGGVADVSIQAGPTHYCSDRTDRVTLPEFKDYTEFEIGFNLDHLTRDEARAVGIYWEVMNWASDSDDHDPWDLSGFLVGPYVNVEETQRLFDTLYVKFGNPVTLGAMPEQGSDLK